MDRDELKKLRDEASATIARIDKAIESMTEKPTPERPFCRGEPVLVWDDEKYKFTGFFAETTGSGFVVSANADLLHSLTWSHCKHLPTFIAWDLIDPFFGYVLEYDSGLLRPSATHLQEIGYKSSNFGTIVAVHKRSEETK